MYLVVCWSFTGVMRAMNLHVLFKQSSFQPENIEHYICGLLAKFELALDFDKKHLLIPSLLPKEQDMSACIRSSEDVKVLDGWLFYSWSLHKQAGHGFHILAGSIKTISLSRSRYIYILAFFRYMFLILHNVICRYIWWILVYCNNCIPCVETSFSLWNHLF